MKTLQEKYRSLRTWERFTLFLLVIAITALIYLGTRGGGPATPSATGEEANRQVVLRSVAELSLDKGPLDLIGTVQSESQVDIRTESAGNIRALSVRLGSQVGAGQVIAEVENSTQRAAVAQARALVDSQQAQLDNLEDSFNGSGDTVAVENASRILLSTGLIAEPEDESVTLAPPVITGTYTGSEQGVYDIRVVKGAQTNDYEFFLKGLENIRTTELPNNEQKSSTLGTRGLRISFPGDLFDYQDTRWLIAVPNKNSSSYAANLNAYNAAVDAQSGVSDQITAQRAQVESAKSNLDAALAQLEKTIIRSPISGTVTNLEIDLGDFVSTFQSVAVVANENQLEIKTYITETDRKGLAVGSPAIVAGEYDAVITSIAPAVDPATKKIEVSVSLSEESAELLNGQSVRVSINRQDFDSTDLDQIFIPLSALKVTAEGVVVFSVNEAGTVEKHVVQEGPLVGDKVLVLEGLIPDMEIVTDVRGISVGDTVTVIE